MAASEHVSKGQFRTVYHGTDSTAWESIQESGLRPSTTAPSSLTVSARPSGARGFAASAPVWNDHPDDRPVVVAARIPSRVFHGYVDVSANNPDMYSLRTTVPPKYLKERKYR